MVLRMTWRLTLMCFAVFRCGSVEVTVGEERKFAPLFEEVVLRCQYSSSSSQTPVVQWWYKSYCRDRTRDSFSFPETLLFQPSKLAGSSHLDCSDSARTVRIIASIRGSSATLAEYYRDRADISIINQLDLRIGRLQWGDSGVYQCKVVISDDPEGKNEAQVELLVLGKIGMLDDLLPDFDLEILPDWVFLGLVILSSCCFLLVVGICWCQCCPHSCCCYLPCCCCRQSCCCPQHLYEAGKVARSQPLFISGVPTMLPIVPPSLFKPKTAAPLPLENSITGVSSLSELSLVHNGNSDSRQTCRPVQKKAVLPASDLLEVLSSQREHSPAPPHLLNQAEESRWNPRSEHLQRKAGLCRGRGGRAGSLDELEEFALSYGQRVRRGQSRERGFALELREHQEGRAPHSPQKRHGSATRRHDDAILSSAREVRGQGRGQGDGWGEGDTPSKTSSGKSSDCYLSISPSNLPKDGVPLLPYCEVERYVTCPSQDKRITKEHKEESSHIRKTITLLNRDSLIV